MIDNTNFLVYSNLLYLYNIISYSSKILFSSYIDLYTNLFFSLNSNSIYDVNIDLLYYSLFIDLKLNLYNFQLNFLNNWYNSFFNNDYNLWLDYSCFYSLDYVYIQSFLNNFFLKYSLNFIPVLYIDFIESSNLLFFSFLNFFFILVLFFFFVYLFILPSYNTEDNISFSSDQAVIDLTVQAEKEIGNPEDFLTLAGFILCSVGFLGNIILFYGIFTDNLNIEMFTNNLFLIVIYFIFSILSFILIDGGLYFLLYLRGVDTSEGWFTELRLDYTFLLAFFSRTFIQLIRLPVAYFSCLSVISDSYSCEHIFDLIKDSDIQSLFSDIILPKNEHLILLDIIKFTFEVVLILLHVSYDMFSQLASLCMTIFWIFNSLYFSYEFNVFELLFKKKK